MSYISKCEYYATVEEGMNAVFNVLVEAGWVELYDFTSLTGFPDRVFKTLGRGDDLAPLYLRIDMPTINSIVRIRFQPFLYWEEGIVDLSVARDDTSKREYTKFVDANLYTHTSSYWPRLVAKRWMLIYASEEMVRVYSDTSLGFLFTTAANLTTDLGVFAYRRLPGIAKTTLTPVSGAGGGIGDWYIAEDLRYFKQGKFAILRDGLRFQHIVTANILAIEYTDELSTGYSGRIQLNQAFTPPASGQLLLERGYTGWYLLNYHNSTAYRYHNYAYLTSLETLNTTPASSWSPVNSDTQLMTFLLPSYKLLSVSTRLEYLIGSDVMGRPSGVAAGSIICVSGYGQEAISRRSASGGSSLSLTDASRTWTTNEHIGKICVITDGTGANQSRVIIGNTATVLQFRSPWIIAPNSTSIYRIVEQAWRVGDDGHCYKETF